MPNFSNWLGEDQQYLIDSAGKGDKPLHWSQKEVNPLLEPITGSGSGDRWISRLDGDFKYEEKQIVKNQFSKFVDEIKRQLIRQGDIATLNDPVKVNKIAQGLMFNVLERGSPTKYIGMGYNEKINNNVDLTKIWPAVERAEVILNNLNYPKRDSLKTELQYGNVKELR